MYYVIIRQNIHKVFALIANVASFIITFAAVLKIRYHSAVFFIQAGQGGLHR
jgi:hypothetical protein